MGVQYMIVVADDAAKLQQEVEANINCGWMPIGGIAISSGYSESFQRPDHIGGIQTNHISRWAQAMIHGK